MKRLNEVIAVIVSRPACVDRPAGPRSRQRPQIVRAAIARRDICPRCPDRSVSSRKSAWLRPVRSRRTCARSPLRAQIRVNAFLPPRDSASEPRSARTRKPICSLRDCAARRPTRRGRPWNARRCRCVPRCRRQIRGDQRRQLGRDIAVHAVVLAPGRLRRVDVEARALSEVPIVGIARRGAVRADWCRARPASGPTAPRPVARAPLIGKVSSVQVSPRGNTAPAPCARAPAAAGYAANFIGTARLARRMLVESLHAAEAALLRNQAQRAH